MRRLQWRYMVAAAVAIYALGFVFAGELLYSTRALFVAGVILLFTSLGLWLRFRGTTKRQEPPSPRRLVDEDGIWQYPDE